MMQSEFLPLRREKVRLGRLRIIVVVDKCYQQTPPLLSFLQIWSENLTDIGPQLSCRLSQPQKFTWKRLKRNPRCAGNAQGSIQERGLLWLLVLVLLSLWVPRFFIASLIRLLFRQLLVNKLPGSRAGLAQLLHQQLSL